MKKGNQIRLNHSEITQRWEQANSTLPHRDSEMVYNPPEQTNLSKVLLRNIYKGRNPYLSRVRNYEHQGQSDSLWGRDRDVEWGRSKVSMIFYLC